MKKIKRLPGTISLYNNLFSQQHHSQIKLFCQLIFAPLQLQCSKHEAFWLIPLMVTGKENICYHKNNLLLELLCSLEMLEIVWITNKENKLEVDLISLLHTSNSDRF